LVSATSFICFRCQQRGGFLFSIGGIASRVSAYLHEDHGGDLLGSEGLGLTEVLDLDGGGGTLGNDLEGPGLDILLDNRVIEGTTDQTPISS
jgi:hypothetical protein